MNARQRQEKKFYEDLYEPLVGAKIVGVKAILDDEPYGMDGIVTVLKVTLDHPRLPSDVNGETVDVEVWQDPEGNGPGFLSVPWEITA